MNQLSWLLYLADVSDNLSWFVTLMVVLTALVSVGSLCAVLGDSDTSTRDGALRIIKWFAPVLCLCFVINAVLPSKETVYAIAASEMGETALKSDTGNKAIGALNAWLDRQIAGEQPAKEDAR